MRVHRVSQYPVILKGSESCKSLLDDLGTLVNSYSFETQEELLDGFERVSKGLRNLLCDLENLRGSLLGFGIRHQVSC